MYLPIISDHHICKTILVIFCTVSLLGCVPTKESNNIVRNSVKFFGAVGDGQTNDTRAFQKGIEALRRKDISSLFIPKGNFLIDSLRIAGLQGGEINGAGMYDSRLIPRGPVDVFIQIGEHNSTTRQRLNQSVKGVRLSQFRIYDEKDLARVGLRLENCQDNILEQIEIRGCTVGLEMQHSWINTLQNFRLSGFSKAGIDLQGKGLNANLFQSIRATSKSSNGICYKVAGNSATFINCTAEGGGTGWEFGYCRMINLIGCHSEHGIPFALIGKPGNINIDGHFIHQPINVWRPGGRRAEAISMRNCYIYSSQSKTVLNIPAKLVIEEGTLQSKVY